MIMQGDTVRVFLQPNGPSRSWSLGICTNQLRDRSYEVLVRDKVYRRNRRHIRPVDETLIMPSDSPLVEDDWDNSQTDSRLEHIVGDRREGASEPERASVLTDVPSVPQSGHLGLK